MMDLILTAQTRPRSFAGKKEGLYLATLKTNPEEINKKLEHLGHQLEGEFFYDDTMRILYATDASAYREMPLAVAIPKSLDDLKN